MPDQDIFNRFVAIVSDQFGVQPKEILPETRLEEDLGADSLDMTEIVCEVEEEFGLYLSDNDVEGRKTVESWVELVESKKAAA